MPLEVVVAAGLLWVMCAPVSVEAQSGSVHVTVKFVEGLEIRLSDGRISGSPSSAAEHAPFLKRKGLDANVVEGAFASLHSLLKEVGILNIQPLFSNEARGLQPQGRGPAERDLRLYFDLALKDPTPDEVDRLIAGLRDLPIVETAYQAPVPEDAGNALPTQ